jgi:hypothetical protein
MLPSQCAKIHLIIVISFSQFEQMTNEDFFVVSNNASFHGAPTMLVPTVVPIIIRPPLIMCHKREDDCNAFLWLCNNGFHANFICILFTNHFSSHAIIHKPQVVIIIANQLQGWFFLQHISAKFLAM